jgi:hypothetical protein
MLKPQPPSPKPVEKVKKVDLINHELWKIPKNASAE